MLRATYIIGPDDDFVVDHDGAFFDFVQTQIGHLRWIQDGRTEERSENAAVGDRERAARRSSRVMRAAVRFFGKTFDVRFNDGKRHTRSASRSTGHHQSFLGAPATPMS